MGGVLFLLLILAALLAPLLRLVLQLKLKGLGLDLHLEVLGLVGKALSGLLEVPGSFPQGGGDVITLQLNLGLELVAHLEQSLEPEFLQVLGGAGLADLNLGLSEDLVDGSILDLKVDLDTSSILLLVGVGLGDGFTDDAESTGLGEGGGNLVGSGSTGNPHKAGVLVLGPDGLDQVLEGVLGLGVVDFINGVGLLVQGLDNGLLSGDGNGENHSALDVSSDFHGVSLGGVGALVGVGLAGGTGSRGLGELGGLADSGGDEDGVGPGVGEVKGEVPVAVEDGFPLAVVSGVGDLVLFNLVDELKSNLLLSDLGGGFLLLSGPDDFEAFVPLGHGLGPWVADHGHVWDLVVGGDPDFSGGLTVVLQVGGGDGELDGVGLGLLGNDAEWELKGEVPFVSDFVVLLGEGDLGGETELHLSGHGEVDLSMDAGLGSGSLDSDLSDGGHDDGHPHPEGHGETEDVGDLTELFHGLDGPLEGDLLNLLVQGVVVQLVHPDVDHAAEVSALDNLFQALWVDLGGDEHGAPEGDGGVGISLAPDVVVLGLEGEGDGQGGDVQGVHSHFPGSAGEEVEELVAAVALDKTETGEELNLALLADLRSVVQVGGVSLCGLSSTEVGNLGADGGGDVLHPAVVVGHGLHLSQGLDGGGNKALEFNVGGDGGAGNPGVLLGRGGLAWEYEGHGGHADGGGEAGVLGMTDQVGEDGVPHFGAGHGIVSGGVLDEPLVGEDGLGPDEGGLVGVPDDLFNVLDGGGVSEDSDGGEEDSLLFRPSLLHDSGPEFVDDEVQDLFLGEPGATELSADLNGELGLSNARVDTGLVGDGG